MAKKLANHAIAESAELAKLASMALVNSISWPSISQRNGSISKA